jgi:anti-anti-sigma factor
MAPQGRVETLQQHDVIIASLKGDVDLSNVGEIRARLLTAIPNAARACVLDISETTYLDSKGLQLLLDTAYRLEIRGQRFLLVVPEHAPVQRLRRLVSISRTIPIVPSLSEAFARLGAPLAADHGS